MLGKHKIIWSAQSDEDVEWIIKFLERVWTEREVLIFLEQLRKFETIVKRFPEIYPESHKAKGLRKAVINPNISVLYKIDKDIIRIVTVIDNRAEN
jgi:plasmid stabilization system protein ParE